MTKDELGILLDKLHYLTQGAELVIFAGSLPRDVADEFYAEAIHDLARRHVLSVLDTEGEPLRLGVEAEPFLVSPNQREAEALVGQEFHDDEDFRLALDQIAELGPRNVIITTDTGCVALLREEREARRFRAVAPRVEPVSTVGSGDVLLAAFVAARHAGKRPRGRAPRGGRRRRGGHARRRRRAVRPAPGGTAAGRRRDLRARAGLGRVVDARPLIRECR